MKRLTQILLLLSVGFLSSCASVLYQHEGRVAELKRVAPSLALAAHDIEVIEAALAAHGQVAVQNVAMAEDGKLMVLSTQKPNDSSFCSFENVFLKK